jgi:hypothetical protein
VDPYAATTVIKKNPMIAYSGKISRRPLLLSQERGFIVARAFKSDPALFSPKVAPGSQGEAVITSTS